MPAGHTTVAAVDTAVADTAALDTAAAALDIEVEVVHRQAAETHPAPLAAVALPAEHRCKRSAGDDTGQMGPARDPP